MSTTVIARFQVKPDQVEAMLALLSGVQSKAIEAGAHSISLMQDQDDPTCIFEIEVWPSADDHKRYVEEATSSGTFDSFDVMLAGPPQANYVNTIKRTES